MKSYLLLFSFLGLFISCETDFDPIYRSEPIPVCYAFLDAEDSIARVRLSKTFILEDAFKQDNIPSDSLEFPDARVWLERWNGDYLYLRAELMQSYQAREPGLFPSSPNPIFILPKDENTARIFDPPNQKDLIKLIIDIPGYPLVYSQLSPLRPASISFPRKNGERITFYSIEGFMPKCKVYSYYQEGWIGIEYTDHYADSDILRTAWWREYHSDSSMFNPPPFKVTSEEFLMKAGIFIPDDDAVRYRTFHKVWIKIFGADRNYYEYNLRAQVSPIDQSGLPYSNLVNAIGLFAATSSTKKWGVLNYFMKDSLCYSQYTRHLKFTPW